MIAKQFFDYGYDMGGPGWFDVGIISFTIRLSRPVFPILLKIFWVNGQKVVKITAEAYYALGNHARNCARVLRIDGRIKRNICELPDSFTDRCKRYGIAIHEYAFLLVLPYSERSNDSVLYLCRPVLSAGDGRPTRH